MWDRPCDRGCQGSCRPSSYAGMWLPNDKLGHKRRKTYFGKKILARIPPPQGLSGRCTVSYWPAPGGYRLDSPNHSVSSQHLKLKAQDSALLTSEGDLFRIMGFPVIILKPYRVVGSGQSKTVELAQKLEVLPSGRLWPSGMGDTQEYNTLSYPLPVFQHNG